LCGIDSFILVVAKQLCPLSNILLNHQDAIKIFKLLTRLAGTIKQVKNWPEAKGDDASIHVESTTKLIEKIRHFIASLQRVEACVKNDAKLKQSLQNCLIPLDLLDLLDYALNPDCFSRGLLQEAMGS
jgi:hypothetical protein